MKKPVFLFICLLMLCSINVFAKDASGTYDLVEVIDGKLYYCNDGCLWASDVNMNNIQLLANHLPEYPLLFIAVRSGTSMEEEKEYMKNTLLWRHLKNRYPDADEESFVEAKGKNYSYYLDELDVLSMLNYLDKTVTTVN